MPRTPPIVLEEPGPLVRVALQLAAIIDAGAIEGAWAWWIREGEKAGGGMDFVGIGDVLIQ